MSPNSLDNPFHHTETNKGTSSELTRRLLSSADAQALTEALGEENQSPKIEPQQDLPPTSDISMSGEEKKEVEKESYWTREQYIEWAQEFGKNEQWMNETFEFQKDGTTVVWGSLNLRNTEIKQLPIGLMEVKGSLNISRNPSINLNGYPKKVGGSFLCRSNNIFSPQGMPKEVGGGIYLESNKISSLYGLPDKVTGKLILYTNELKNLDGISKEISGNLNLGGNNQLTSLEALKGVKIGGDLWLRDIPATTIPVGIQIGGNIFIKSSQTDLIADAKRKGYRLRLK